MPTLKPLLLDPSVMEKEGVPWEVTNFKNQNAALGLEENTFVPAPNLEKAVSFWIKVYTEYRTDQGIVHDTENLAIIYEKIDFDFINKDSSLGPMEKAKARDAHLEARKKFIYESLRKIADGAADEALTDFDKNIRSLWEKEGGVPALTKAADLSRLRFQLGQSDRFKEAIFLSGRYLPMMERIFKEEGLPIQLTRLVFVESSFDVSARSRVGASGLWQIMPFAARGRLRMNKTYDLRNHPVSATEFAAKMLKFNYQLLGAWPLAITGYNHGPYGVKRLAERYQTRDLGELIANGEGKSFGFASRNFYASFLAVLHVEGKAGEYFPGLRKATELQAELLTRKGRFYFSDVIKYFDGNREVAELYNPHLLSIAYKDKAPLDQKSRIMVPRKKSGLATKSLHDDNTSENSRKPDSLKAKVNSKTSPLLEDKSTRQSKSHRVSAGDPLSNFPSLRRQLEISTCSQWITKSQPNQRRSAFSNTLTSLVIILVTNNVVLAKIAAELDLDKYNLFITGVANAVFCSYRNFHIASGADGNGFFIENHLPLALSDNPMFFSLRMTLIRDLLFRRHFNHFRFKDFSVLEDFVSSPGTVFINVLRSESRPAGFHLIVNVFDRLTRTLSTD